MGALASPLLACSGLCLFHVHVLGLLYAGLACSIRLAHHRTSLSLSHCCQSTSAPADQVVILRCKCGSHHRSRINRATVDLSCARASWLILPAYHCTSLNSNLV